MTQDSSQTRADRAEEVFADFLARLESGEPVALEALCERHPDLADDLRELHAAFEEAGQICEELKGASYLATVPGAAALLPRPATVDDSTWQRLLRLLEARHNQPSRYRLLGQIAEGGMGVILKVWDNELDRPLAMKVALDRAQDDAGRSTPMTHSLGRFLEEAQVTGQLDHPGIVPVHELGLDADRRVFFTMRLVQGQNLREVIDAMHAGKDAWTLTRVVGIVLKVCEAVAYAHSKGVLHRDLKPSNIMVGRFGEVYTMDWGLAKVLAAPGGGPAADDEARAASGHGDASMDAAAPRRAEGLTLPGLVLGTPAYMAPEQARGQSQDLDARTDVYALGAILYHVLTGLAPYADAPGRGPEDIVLLVREQPPTAVHRLRRDLPPELEAICERAMAREPGRRYQDVLALAEDLRAYLEQRVVRAYETGPLAELRKWVLRNRGTALALVAAVLLSITFLGLLSWQKSRSAHNLRTVNQQLDSARSEAVHHLQNYQRLEDISELQRLQVAAQDLWPAWPEQVPAMQAWLRDAEALAARLPLHRQFLDEVRVAGPGPDVADTTRAWLPGLLESFVAELTAFTDADPMVGAMASVVQRIDDAGTIAQRSLDDHADAWEEAISEIYLSDRYDGLELTPQLGLVPLGPDPDTGLWEFAVLGSGALPVRGTDGALTLQPDLALVLVLIPGGTATIGVQADDRDAPRYVDRPFDQGPLHEVDLDPYFLSRFEMTQFQWHAVTGTRPSFFPIEHRGTGRDWRPLPVEQVSHTDAVQALRRLGLVLPTEVQWEAAARAGTDTRWWCGDTPESIHGAQAGNVYDLDSRRTRPDDDWGQSEEWHDGHADTAPVGQFAPNAFGLHDVIGNVQEWCLDRYGPYERPARRGDGMREVGGDEDGFVYRGGSFDLRAGAAGSAARDLNTSGTANFNLGVRPARALFSDQDRGE